VLDSKFSVCVDEQSRRKQTAKLEVVVWCAGTGGNRVIRKALATSPACCKSDRVLDET
jgi:hypothetical protein